MAGAVAGEGLGDDGDGEAVDLSVVLAARNDDHASQGTFITRLRNSLQVLARHAWRDAELRVEIIVVSWADVALPCRWLERAAWPFIQDGPGQHHH